MIPSPVHINLPPYTMVKSREQKMIKTHMTGTVEWGCNWYEQGMELIDEHLFWGMLTMTIGESLGYPHPIPTISTPSRVPSFHHGASGRSWHRPWRHRRTADSCPATAAWAPARSKMGTAQMVRRHEETGKDQTNVTCDQMKPAKPVMSPISGSG